MKTTPQPTTGQWMIIRLHQTMRVVHGSHCGKQNMRGMLQMPLTGLVVCRIHSSTLPPEDWPVNPAVLVAQASSLLTFPESLPILQPHASDANTHTPQPVSCDEPRCSISTTCCHKYVFVNKTRPLATLRLIYILICGISAPSPPRTRRFPTGLFRSTSSRAIFESG